MADNITKKPPRSKNKINIKILKKKKKTKINILK